jgi:hypothetical protein
MIHGLMHPRHFLVLNHQEKVYRSQTLQIFTTVGKSKLGRGMGKVNWRYAGGYLGQKIEQL